MNKKRSLVLAGILTASCAALIGPSLAGQEPMVTATMAMCADAVFRLTGVEQESDAAVIAVQKGYASRFGFIDRTGKQVIAPQYEQTASFHEGMCAVRVKKRWGFINRTGKMVVPPTYNRVLDYSEGLAPVREGIVWSYIDKEGRQAIAPNNWRTATAFKNGVARVAVGDKQGLIRKDGKFICQNLDEISEPSEYLFRTKKGSKYGFVNSNGTLLLEPQFSDASNFSESLAAVSKDGKWGYIDGFTRMVIPPKFDTAGDFHNGVAVVSVKGKYGLIDRRGAYRLRPAYSYLSTILPPEKAVHFGDNRFSSLTAEGLTPIIDNSLWGFADSTGKIVVKCQFGQVQPFSEGLASVAIFDMPIAVANAIKNGKMYAAECEAEAKAEAEAEPEAEPETEDETESETDTETKNETKTNLVEEKENRSTEQ